MASQRPGLGPSGLSADSRLKSPGTIAPPGSLLLKKRGGESSTERVRTLPQPKMPSRLPQSLPQRRPSDTQPEPIQPRPTAGNRNSKILGNTTSITSASSSRLPAPTSKPRNVLRRKNSGISNEVVNSIRKDSRDETGNHSKTSSSSSSSNPRSQTSIDSSASSRSERNPTINTMEVRVAHQVEVAVGAPQAPALYPELDRYRDVKVPAYNGSFGIEVLYPLTTHDLPPPTPLFSGSSSQMSGFSSSPCTGFSGSPGPGPYSRDTTPTSMSSQSPGMVAPLRFPGAGVRMRQVDLTQTRPPVSRRRGGSISNELDLVSADPQGLPSVRESLTSSSSNSTVRELERKDSKKRKQLSPLPPSPPSRISSHKFTKSHDGSLSPPRPWRAPPTQPTAPAAVGAQLLPKPGSFSRPRPAQTAQQVPPPRGQPPRRPSRDGTPDLNSQLGLPVPVIQSNLTFAPSEKRSSKLLAPAIVARPGLLSSTSDTHVHLLRPAIAREATPAPKMSRMVDDASTIKAEPGRTTRTPSPGVSTFRRFPLFGRRTKTAPEVPLQKDEKKPTRKGPAAGTGHEGYGRVGPARRRSNSLANTSRAIPGTMSSQESIGTNDSFLLERMAPVVIAGGEIIENRNVGSDLSRTGSSQSVTREPPSVESQNGSQVSLNSIPRNTLWPSAFPRAGQHAQSASVSSRRPSESSESETPVIKSTLALRRSIQRLKSGEKEPPRIPAPIVTQPHVTSPSITSIDAGVLMTDDSMMAPSIDAAQGIKASEGSKNLSGPKRLMKRARSPRKWNFFGRNHSQPAPETKKVDISENAAPVAAVAATVKVVQSKPLAFYTMMDSSEQEDTDIPDLEEVLREAKSPDSPTHKQIPDSQNRESEECRPSVTQENTHPSFLTSEASAQVPTVAELEHMSPVKFSKLPTPPSMPSSVATQAGNTTSPAQGRPSRLPQVGRIPKVISARAEQISPKSFSRPFHRLSVQATPSKMDLRDAYSIAKGPSPSPPRPSTPVPMEPATTAGMEAPMLTQSPGSMLPTYPTQIGQEFLSFSPRKGSQCTTNTTTSSSSGGFNFAEATAVIPEPDAPLAEDEIWDEYDDLFGDETLKQPPSTRSSFGNQFHLEKYTATPTRRIEPPLESPTLRSQFQEQQVQSLTQIMHSERIPVSSSVYSSDMAEKVKQLLADHPSPRCSLEPDMSRESEMQLQNEAVSKQSELEQELETEKQTSSLPVDDPRRSDSSGCSQSSEDGSPLALVNLRVGSMTVSKWLTFGHVLFSPVRDELLNDMGSLKRPSILVIDGLGNDDWSFYAAETYPAATFFNLSPRPPRPAARNGSTGLPLSPPNHYQTRYMSHTGKFPFGAESFTAVVFRFPAAAPEAHYRNIISEARRVLKPGGYIELSILDVDLNNMGNRGRKAVRHLKERINAKSPDVSLGSTSDLILRLLGRKGFADLKTCRVGVPVASVIPRSSGSENGKRSKAAGKGKTIKDERTLPEMISDGSPVADESITKMVAKVGRWWYSRCYESAAGTDIGPGTLGSMWRDKALLAECEEWGTSLKLMVCHARAPDGRPRLASI